MDFFSDKTPLTLKHTLYRHATNFLDWHFFATNMVSVNFSMASNHSNSIPWEYWLVQVLYQEEKISYEDNSTLSILLIYKYL